MVFGNRGSDSGTGVAFTRDPATGRRGVYGDYLENAQGEDVVAGIRNTVGLPEAERPRRVSSPPLVGITPGLEHGPRDGGDIESPIARGKLWMPQPRVARRPP